MLNRQYDAVVRDILGVTTLTAEQGQKPSDILFADFDGPMVSDAWRLYQQVAQNVADEVWSNSAEKANFISCDPSATGCLTTTIQNFGRKAFRHPLSDEEVQRFTALGSTMPAGTPDQVAEATLVAFLESPSFIYIPELATTMDSSGEGIDLSSYEVAARLSFALWGSVPDDTLNAAADANMLQTKDQILAQAQRMLQVKDKAGPMIADFHRVAWAQDNNTATSHWWKMDHDDNPLYQSALKPTYQAEIDDFFDDVAFSGGSFKDLLLSNVAFVTKDTAAIYGLDPTMYGTDLTRVTLDATQRPGFLTRIGFLSSYSHPDDTSPILRGAFVTVHLIGIDPGPPLPGATMVPVPPGNYTTNRDKIIALTSSQDACKSCHIPYINPPGFVLENYDSIGKWQTVDPLGGQINPVADVAFTSTDTETMHNAQELMTKVSTLPMAKQIYAQTWVNYATGRDPNNQDQCIIDSINTKLSSDGYTVLDMIADITQADSFRMRVQATP
ncbi:MAG TPA: DUF1592 domain-containing protein [Polyangiaceae bacterium]|nr:DUF1592 domain-containing protein [Polyangiaceae bacterium]